MFSFLKDKLKGAISKFTKKVEEAPVEKVETKEILQELEIETVAPVEEKKVILEKKHEVKQKREEQKPEAKKVIETPVEVKKEEPKVIKEAPKVEIEKPKVEIKKVEIKPAEVQKTQEIKKVTEIKKELDVETPKVEEKKGFFKRLTEKITTTKISEEKFEELFWDLELAMLENNVAVEVIHKIKDDLIHEIVEKPITRGKTEEVIISTLKKSLDDVLSAEPIDLVKSCKSKKPFVICFVGINGSGKTTTIAKVAKMLQDNKLSVVMAAADKFRAAAIDKLQLHADNLGVKLIKQDYGSDAAAVAFDAIKHAESKNKDVVLIDTAGRLHSNINLVDEMKKIIRVSKPDLKIFIGESITGNDCVEQARLFDEAIGIDGIILSKADIDEKGGAALSVSYVTKKPILYLGTGQNYGDLEVFDKEKMMKRLGL